MTIYLVRHGEKQKIAGDPGLTKLGIRQAQATAEYFATNLVQKIVSSPLLRTQETAKIIAERLSTSFSVDKRLLERSNWEGDIPFAQFMEYWRKTSTDRSFQPPIGDSSFHAGKRLAEEITEVGKEEFQSILFVTHGGIITDFLRNITSDEYLLSHFFHTVKNLRDTEIPECSITQIETEGDRFNLVKLCSTDHLKQV